MSLRVLIDATPIPAQLLGAGHYVVRLIGALAERSDQVDLHVLVKERDRDALAELAPGAALHGVNIGSRPARIAWEQTLLPRRARGLAPDVFHGPHYTLPPALRCPTVVTFHDPTFFTLPQLHERAKVPYFTRMARLGVRRATRVIAVSEYAGNGVIEHAGADPGAVDVVYLGVDLQTYTARPGPDDERLRAERRVKPPYLFWVGAIEPRKDLPTLVRAFTSLVREGAPHSLVLAGPSAWGADALSRAIVGSGFGARIRRLGYVSEPEKIALYRGADALVYPSIAEGFGLQVLEGMACGTPVITTTGSAPEEVGGDAVELAPPHDAEALAAAIRRILEDAARADELRRRGPERAESFPWERTAEHTLASYRRAVQLG